MLGQYTYFSNGYLPPYPEIGSGQSNSLFVRGDTLFTYGFAPSPDDDGEGYDYVRYLYYLDNEGILINEIIHLLNDEFIYMDFSDNYSEMNNGYVSSTGNDLNPVIMWCDNNFTESFRVEYPELYTDTTVAAFFTSTTVNFEKTISIGRIVYDLIPEIPGQNYSNLLLAKHDGDGNEIWFHEYSATDLEIDEEDYSGPFVFPRGGVFELSDSSLIVFGSVGNDLDCYAFKFDSLGN
jgi:hypothetical protein